MTTTRIPVSELQIGMYVARLDLSWFRSPFIRHSFLIDHPSQIEKLVRAGVKMVDIDLDKGIASQSHQVLDTNHSATKAEPTWSIQKQSKPLAQLNEEYAKAKLAKQQMDQAVQSIFTTIIKTGTVNPQHAAEAVQEITIAMRTLTDSAVFMALSQNRAGDATLSRHALTICTLSLVLGQAFQFNPLELHEMATAALLHDIGLLQIRPTVVHRSHAADVSKADRQEFETHPRRAVLMLEQQGKIETAILHLIANHHVYLDDSGYPQESRGQFTSDRTRILMVVDRYDELIAGFGGAPPLTHHQTFQRLYQEARQGKLDPRILSSFIARVGIYPVHSYVRLNTQELAVVTKLNQEKLHQPIVTITHQSGGTQYLTPFVVDLAHQTDKPRTRAIETIIAMDPRGTNRGGCPPYS